MSAHDSLSFGGVDVDSRTVEDVDAIALAMSDGLQGEYVQLESKPFHGRWTTLRAPSIVVQFGSHDSAVARRVRVAADRCAVMVPLALPAAARWNGHAVRPDEVILCPPRSECLAFDPPSARFAILTTSLAAPLPGPAAPFASNASGPIAADCGSDARALRDRLARVQEAVESGQTRTLADADIRFEASLGACLDRAASAPSESALAGTRSRIVRRAEEFFRRHVSEGVSVTQLSTVAGVSERSLRNAFYEVYTTSPKRYMKLWQLHQVRRALRSGEARATTVTDAATCYGFYELGRFAGAYKAFFGEAPSETLNKAAHRTVIAGAA